MLLSEIALGLGSVYRDRVSNICSRPAKERVEKVT